MDSIKVTMMIPTYNQAKRVGKAIETALEQTYDNIEIVVANDNSTDRTDAVISKYAPDENVKYYKNSTNLGRRKNYYYTLRKRTTGDWVLNLDGDDYLADNTFIKDAVQMIKKADGHPVMLCAGLYKDKYQTNEIELPKYDSGIIDGNEVFLNWHRGSMNINHASTLYKRKEAIESGFYNWKGIGTDRVSLKRLCLEGQVLFMKKPVAVWNQHGDNESYTSDLDQHISNVKSIDYLHKEAKKNQDINKKKLKKWYTRSKYIEVRNTVIKLLNMNEYVSAIYFTYKLGLYKKHVIKAITYLVISPKTYGKEIAKRTIGLEEAKKLHGRVVNLLKGIL